MVHARRLLLFVLLALVASLVTAVPARAGTPEGFREVTVFSGLDNPTGIQFVAGGAILVAEKSGIIKRFDSLTDTTPFVVADLRVKVHNYWDRGLLGFVADPAYPTKPYLYVLYAHDAAIGATAPRWGTATGLSDPCPSPPGPTDDGCLVSGRLSRLQVRADGTAGPEQVLIEDWCQQYPSHSVGALAFGPDGALYASGGDGASFTFTDFGQEGAPVNPCGDPPGGRGAALTPPTAEGGALRSQDLRTTTDPVGLNGTVIRVDPATGLGLPGNPMAGSADVNARRIVASGLRNPFRFALRPGTEEVWVGDVGWSGYEEVNRLVDPTDAAPDNFGWPCYEGPGTQSGYSGAGLAICQGLEASPGAVTAPHVAYRHSQALADGACRAGSSSVSGVAFYPGGDYPAQYDGAMFFADYSRNCIFAVPAGANGLPDAARIEPFVTAAAGPVALATGPDGDVYYVDMLGGTIRRIEYAAPAAVTCPVGEYKAEYFPNRTLTGTPTVVRCEAAINNDWGVGAPVAGIAADNFSVRWTGRHRFTGGNVAFRATADDGIRARLDGQLFLDGWKDQAPTAYTAERTVTAGEHDVVVEYYEATGGAVARFSWEERVAAAAPVATINTPDGNGNWRVGDTITFSGGATDAKDGALAPARLSWSLLVHHCPSDCHVHPVEERPGVAGGSFTAPDHEHPSWLELQLTATDSDGLTGTDSVRLDPQTVQLTLASQPTGLALALGAETAVTPFTRTLIAGSVNSVGAPSPQDRAGTSYEFDRWSDAGSQTHNVVAGASTTYTATYAAVPVGCPSGQYLAEYFPNRTMTGDPVATRCEAAVDHDWGEGAPTDGIAPDNFSVRWTARRTFPGGNVNFVATGDDGIRIRIDGAVVLDGWRDQPATRYEAVAPVTAGTHEVVVEHYDSGGSAVAQASWR